MHEQTPPLTEAIQHFKSQAELARFLEVSPSMVNQWVKALRPIPTDQMAAIERGTGGRVNVERFDKLTRWVRIPDPDWPNPRGRPLLDVARPQEAAPATADAPTGAGA